MSCSIAIYVSILQMQLRQQPPLNVNFLGDSKLLMLIILFDQL